MVGLPEMRELIRLANSLRRVTKWHEQRISELMAADSSISELLAEDDLESEQFVEFMELFVRGATKDEIADALQIDLTTADLSGFGGLEW